MSAESAALVRSFRVGRRTVTITVPHPRRGAVGHTAIEWSPDVPRRLSKREMRQYRDGRDAAFAEIGEALGLRIAVLEL